MLFVCQLDFLIMSERLAGGWNVWILIVCIVIAFLLSYYYYY